MGSYTPSNFLYKRSLYYKKQSKPNPALDFEHFYGVVEPSMLVGTKYKYNLFLFYPEGIVLNETFYSDRLFESISTYKYKFLVSKCHGWSMGCYAVSNDTIRFDTRIGYADYWNQYEATISDSSLIVFKSKINKTDTLDKKQLLRLNSIIVSKDL